MDANERQAFLAIVGRGLRQAAMAASVFKTADVNLPRVRATSARSQSFCKPQTVMWSQKLMASDWIGLSVVLSM